jgi:hypothetical protein
LKDFDTKMNLGLYDVLGLSPKADIKDVLSKIKAIKTQHGSAASAPVPAGATESQCWAQLSKKIDNLKKFLNDAKKKKAYDNKGGTGRQKIS